MGSAEAELNNLALNLKKVEEKFLQWTGDCLKTSLLEGKQIHENILLDRREKLQHLEESINRNQIQSERNLEELRQRAEEVSNLEQELRELQISAQQLTERRTQSQKHLEETQCCLEKQQKDIATKEQSTSYKIQQCTKGTKYFEERLGLAFKKVDVKNCMPEVQGLEDMVHQLNTTNNFSKFVRSMRKSFKKTVKTPNNTNPS
ncbi:kinetochore protein Spc25-like isoform X2 [Acropora muricata]|uniref:kinetochore protein Spc25-like isoform X2 n=1 Tax=Acropora muricata TaxID=159855 RepID=UPI0034E5D1D4